MPVDGADPDHHPAAFHPGTNLSHLAPTFEELAWDVDTLMLQSKPGFVQYLAPVWEVATKGAPAQTEAPFGLCVTTWPFFTILTVGTQSPETEAMLVGMSNALRTTLRQVAGLNNPVILPRGGEQKPWSAVGKGPSARVGGAHLDAALLELAHHFEFSLWHFSFGLKLEARDMFVTLGRLHSALTAAFGQEDVQMLWSSSFLDLGTEFLTQGGVVVVKPCRRIPGSNQNVYPLFPLLGQGYGGFTCSFPPEGQELKKMVFYPGGWKHALIKAGSLPLLASPAATLRWFQRMRGPVRKLLDTLAAWEDPMGGVRFEVRCTPQISWDDQQAFLRLAVQHGLPLALALDLPKDAILAKANEAYLAVTDAGLWGLAGGENSIAPPWRKQLYHRLLSTIGFSHRFWAKLACRQANAPWHGPPQLAPLIPPPAAPAPPPREGEPLAPTLDPRDMGPLAEADLTADEQAVLARLPTKSSRGGGFCCYLQPPWGGGRLPRTKAYLTKPALARAIWQWAAGDWPNRVKLQ